MTDVTPGWKHVSIGFEGDPVLLSGLNPWELQLPYLALKCQALFLGPCGAGVP